MGNIFEGFGGLMGQGKVQQQGNLLQGIGAGETFGGGGVKKPETAVAWLDRRVEEIRVKL